ncbi:MAG: hypothetical protein NZ742_01915 [Acidobacteria bacterium]|nr:hypothetical protein [Acidobacteriota bacterium]MDW7983601.1 hypothetical protein [Acidobacteriota bacterium]
MATDVDLKRDLGVDDRRLPEARLTWRLGRPYRFRFAYTTDPLSGRPGHLSHDPLLRPHLRGRHAGHL